MGSQKSPYTTGHTLLMTLLNGAPSLKTEKSYVRDQFHLLTKSRQKLVAADDGMLLMPVNAVGDVFKTILYLSLPSYIGKDVLRYHSNTIVSSSYCCSVARELPNLAYC